MAEIIMNIKATDNASGQINNVSKSLDFVEKNAKEAEKATNVLGGALSKAFFAVELIKVGFEAGKKVFEFMSKNSEDFGKSVQQIESIAQKVAGVFTQILSPAIEGAVNFISELMKSKPFIEAVSSAFTALTIAVDVIIKSLGGAFQQILKTIQDNFANLFSSVGKNVSAFEVFGGIMQYVSSAIKIVSQNISSLINIVGSVVNAYIEAGKTIGAFADLVTGKISWKDFKDQAVNAGNAITGVYKTAIKEVGNVVTTITGEIGNFSKGSQKIAAETQKQYEITQKQIENAVQETTKIVENENQKQSDSVKNNTEKQLTAWQQFQNKFKDIINTANQIFQSVGNAIKDVMSNIFSAIASDSENQLKNLEKSYKDTITAIDEETQKRLEAMGLADQTELEKAQEKYDQLLAMNQEYGSALTEQQEAQLSSLEEKIVNQTDSEIQEAIRKKREKELNNNAETLSEAKKELDKQKILEQSNKKKEEAEKQYQAKRAEIEKKAFEADKANKIAQVWLATAMGVAGAWASAMTSSGNPIAGAIIAAVATTALLANAGIQTGIIASQNYTPAFQSGGIVPGNSFSGDMVNARVNSGEMILNQDQQQNLFDRINTGNIGGEQTVNIYLDSSLIMSKIITGRKFAEVR